MRRFAWLFLLCAAVFVLLAGCAGESTAPPLPTATPAPTQPIPTATSTATPPPTVTPFPTITPRPEETATPVEAGDDDDGEATEAPEDASSEEPTDAAAVTEEAPTEPPPPPTQELPANAPEGAAGTEPVFTAGFEAGWPDIDQNTVKTEMKDGVYTFEVGPFDGASIDTTQIDETNVYITVEVTAEECPKKGGYGILFSFADRGTYYSASVYCSNTFSLAARLGGSLIASTVTNGDVPSAIDVSTGTHILTVRSQDGLHTLILDGIELGSMASNLLTDGGDVALYAFAQDEDVTRVTFDNLEVWALR